MNDMKLVLWRIPGSVVPAAPFDVWNGDINYASNPALFGLLADGWVVTSHTVIAVDADLLLTLFLTKPIVIPEDASAV